MGKRMNNSRVSKTARNREEESERRESEEERATANQRLIVTNDGAVGASTAASQRLWRCDMSEKAQRGREIEGERKRKRKRKRRKRKRQKTDRKQTEDRRQTEVHACKTDKTRQTILA
jgi:hypothetical protein